MMEGILAPLLQNGSASKVLVFCFYAACHSKMDFQRILYRNNTHLVMKNKVFGLPSEKLKNLNWLFHWLIFLSQVMNETMNMRTIFFFRALTFIFCGEKQNFQEKMDFCFFRKKNCILF